MDAECEFDCEAFQGEHRGDVCRYAISRGGKPPQIWNACERGVETARKAGYDVEPVIEEQA